MQYLSACESSRFAEYPAGQTLTEYTIILVVVALASTGIYLALGNNVNSLANGANSSLTNA